MKILAIESSSLVAGAAIWTDDVITAEYTVNFKKTHSQTLLPMIEEIVRMTETDLNEIDAIAVSGGPGSFTGLRIGSATAKGLGLALGKPLIHVPTLEAMAYQMYLSSCLICPVMDARRNQVYTGLYRFEGETFHIIMEQTPMDIAELMERINECGERTVFLGDGVPVYRDKIIALAAVPVSFAPAFSNRQRAAAVASLGAIYAKNGRLETAAEHTPVYLRASQAERERAERENA